MNKIKKLKINDYNTIKSYSFKQMQARKGGDSMKKSQRNCLTVTLLMGMMFLAAIFTLQGALLTSLIAHYSVADSVQGFASSAASAGGVLALISSFFLIGHLSKLLLLRLAVAACAVFLALLKISPTFAVFVAMWFAQCSARAFTWAASTPGLTAM